MDQLDKLKRQPFATEHMAYAIAKINQAWKLQELPQGITLFNCDDNIAIPCNTATAILLRALDDTRTLSEIAVSLAADYQSAADSLLDSIIVALNQLWMQGAVDIRGCSSEQRRLEIETTFSAVDSRSQQAPWSFFDAIFCINLDSEETRWRQIQQRFERLGIADRVIRYPAVETRAHHHYGCALSHRKLVALAKKHQMENILVFEDDALFTEDSDQSLSNSLAELEHHNWKLFYLGAYLRNPIQRNIPNHQCLRTASRATCTHAVSYHARSYDQILREIPDNLVEIIPWCDDNLAIDQYLMNHIDESYLAYPTVSAQPISVRWEEPELQDRFQ